MAAYLNTMSRYAAIEEEARNARMNFWFWTDFFKPVHLDAHPDLHDTFWQQKLQCM